MRNILCLTAMCLLLGVNDTHAGYIIVSPYDTVVIPQNLVGSGNGTLDLQMFTFLGSSIPNDDFDDGNNTLPQGGGADTDLFAESYVTTAGDLKAYYSLNFPQMPSNEVEIVLFLDLNETGTEAEATNLLARVDVVLNPVTDPNPAVVPDVDVTSAQQAAINQSYTGGTIIANLNPNQLPVNLPIASQGAGFADYAIFTGVNPFTYNDTDVLLFNVSMNTLNNGSEDIFLSGTYSGTDIRDATVIPEPATLAIWTTLGGLGLIAARRRQRTM